MEENKKITKEELNKIQDFQNQIAKTLQQVGFLEADKHALLHSLAETNKAQEDLKKELEGKYGKISINVADGSYEEIKEEEENKEG